MKEKCAIFAWDMVTMKGSTLKVWGPMIIRGFLQNFSSGGEPSSPSSDLLSRRLRPSQASQVFRA